MLTHRKPKEARWLQTVASFGFFLFTKQQTSDLSRLKVFAEDNFNVEQIVKYIFDRVENIVKTGENAGYQHFSPFLTMFSKAYFFMVNKTLRFCCKDDGLISLENTVFFFFSLCYQI